MLLLLIKLYLAQVTSTLQRRFATIKVKEYAESVRSLGDRGSSLALTSLADVEDYFSYDFAVLG